MALDSQRVLLVFDVGGRLAALPLDRVERIASMAQLACPPGMPASLEGILSFGGAAVPVLRLDRLLRLPVQDVGLYSMLIILKSAGKNTGTGRFALLVSRTSEVLSVPQDDLLPVDERDSFNACAEASFSLRGEKVPLLSSQRILLEKETQALSEFQTLAQHRLEELGAAHR